MQMWHSRFYVEDTISRVTPFLEKGRAVQVRIHRGISADDLNTLWLRLGLIPCATPIQVSLIDYADGVRYPHAEVA